VYRLRVQLSNPQQSAIFAWPQSYIQLVPSCSTLRVAAVTALFPGPSLAFFTCSTHKHTKVGNFPACLYCKQWTNGWSLEV